MNQTDKLPEFHDPTPRSVVFTDYRFSSDITTIHRHCKKKST